MSTFTDINDIKLYKIKKKDREKLYSTLLSAFEDYPKLDAVFTQKEKKMAALEASIRYYCAYDLRYGAAFSLSSRVEEAVVMVHSDNMRYSLPKHILSGSYSRGYMAAAGRLSPEERRLRSRLFEEMDSLEEAMDIPLPHIYIDFLGVKKELQHQGRGRRLMKEICRYAESRRLPIMLFTNTDSDVRFYESMGFKVIGATSSDRFGFTNTYLIRF